jgi:hypothetical protein
MLVRAAMSAPYVVPVGPVAYAFVNVTVPQLTRGTCAPFCVKSSTIHSACIPHRAFVEDRVCVTCWFFELFLIVAVPVVLLVAVTETVTESPASNVMLELGKLISEAGYHSYQAGKWSVSSDRHVAQQ